MYVFDENLHFHVRFCEVCSFGAFGKSFLEVRGVFPGHQNEAMVTSSWRLFGAKLVAFGIEIVFFEVWETSVILRCNWNLFSKIFGADAGQPEGHFVL